MKKTFLLTDEKKDPQRVLDSIKNDVRKYIKREKRKKLSDDLKFWKINCKFGKNEKESIDIKFEDIINNINQSSESKWESFYIELISEEKTMIIPEKKKIEKLDTEEIEDK